MLISISLSTDVSFPEDCIQIIRSRPFTFSARSCNKWSLGRVILCGDAAHVFPPCKFTANIYDSRADDVLVGGQGIASGFRDAISVAWRLAITCRPGFEQHEKLFEAWYGERKQQLEKSLAATIVNGNLCNERNALKITLRNWSLWFQQLLPSWRHQMELGQRQEGMARYDWKPGYPFLASKNGGRAFPQVFCLPYRAPRSRPLFTDDVIFAKSKSGLFQVVVLLQDPKDMKAAKEDLARLGAVGINGELKGDEATYLVQNLAASSSEGAADVDLEGAFEIIQSDKSHGAIWDGLPYPEG